MTSPRLKILERQMARHNQPERIPAPATDDLGAAIEALIAERVEQALAREREQQRHSPKVQRLMDDFNKPAPVTDFKQLPPTPMTPPPKNMSALIIRDGAGLARWVQIGDKKLEAIRDRAGVLLGMKQVDESPVLPAPDIAVKAKARDYQPPVPR